MAEEKKEEVKLQKKDLVKHWLLGYSSETCYNYERLQALGTTNAMVPIVRRLYKTKEEQAKALKKYTVFFNTEPSWIGTVIHGVAASMEEQAANGADIDAEDINAVRTGLMGPMAGIGDTIDWGTWKPLFFSIAASFSTQGGIAGFFICFLFALVPFLEGWYLSKLGYRLGREAISKLLEGGWIKQLIMGSSILGLFMVGALSASNVALEIPIAFTMGGTETSVQAILDSILPSLLPLTLVLGIYTFFRKKGQKFGRVVFFLLGLSMVGSLIGLF